MATQMMPRPEGLPASLIRRFYIWQGWRRLYRVIDQARAEILWLRGQVMVASATNKRISQMNDAFSQEIAALKAELEQYTIADPNASCPVCGHRDGTIKALVDAENRRVVVQHHCKICTFDWATSPITEDSFAVFQPTPGDDVRGGSIL